MNNKLAAKIIARNYVNCLANDLLPEILEAVRPFVGQKVIRKTGGMSGKLDAALGTFRYSAITNIWFNVGTEHLKVTFKTRQVIVDGNGGCVYAEQAVTFAGLEDGNGVLKELYPTEPFRTDFTVEEIETARKRLRIARNAAYAAELKLGGFGEYDND